MPNTSTTVVLNLATPCSPVAQRDVLNATYNFILAQITASGDGQLPQDVDPFYYDQSHGVFFQAQSVKGEHLTWGILGAAAGFLLQHQAVSDYGLGGTFSVHDGNWGLVGTGQIAVGYSGVALPKIVDGPAGVTKYS